MEILKYRHQRYTLSLTEKDITQITLKRAKIISMKLQEKIGITQHIIKCEPNYIAEPEVEKTVISLTK